MQHNHNQIHKNNQNFFSILMEKKRKWMYLPPSICGSLGCCAIFVGNTASRDRKIHQRAHEGEKCS